MIYVRTAGERDFPAIAKILSTTRGHTFNAVPPGERLQPQPLSSAMRERLRQRLTQPDSEFVVADEGQGAVGMAFATFDAATKAVRLRQLFMHPDRQDPVIATLLLDEIESSFPDATTLRVDLDGDQQAIDFYVGNGFAKVGESADEGCGPMTIYERAILWAEP